MTDTTDTQQTEPKVVPAREFRYHAFISYRTATSHRCAIRLRNGLHRIARRHPEAEDLEIFLDRARLGPGGLERGILDALDQSRCLIVVLDRSTNDSPWVGQEIAHWLAGGGTADRLFLVKADSGLDLSWHVDDDGKRRFADAALMPEPLRALFDQQQLWLDLSRWIPGTREDLLVKLCAAVTEVGTKEFQQEEIAFQQRRRLRLSGLVAAMAILTVVAIIAATVAVISRDAAKRNEQEALAQANAAEALLLAPDDPARAIQRAVTAGTQSTSSSVRSVLLAVSQSARRLELAVTYPEATAGTPAKDATFSPDGTWLFAYGDGRTPGTSFLQIWDLDTRAVIFSGPLAVPSLRSIVTVSRSVLVACSDTGPVILRLQTGRITLTRLGSAPGRPTDTQVSECGVEQLSGGAIAAGTAAATGREGAYFIGRSGTSTWIAGVTSVARNPASRYALLGGQAGLYVVGPQGVNRVYRKPVVAAAFADSRGSLLAHLGGRDWATLRVTATGTSMKRYQVPAGVADVAPMLNYNRMTDDLAWIYPDGRLGWSRNAQTTQLRNTKGTVGWRSFRPRIVPLAFQDFVAVVGSTAVIARPPTGESVVIDAPTDEHPGPLTSWDLDVVDTSLGSASTAGDQPIGAECPEHSGVIAPQGLSLGDGALLIEADGTTTSFDGKVGLADNCTVIGAGTQLLAKAHLDQKPIVVVDRLQADAVVYSADGTRVAMLKAGQPLQILSTAPATSLPTSADIGYGEHGLTAGFGERHAFREFSSVGSVGSEAGSIVFTHGAEVRRVPFSGLTTLDAIAPDGGAAVITTVGADRRTLIGPGRTASDVRCGADLAFVPAAGYEHSVAAAEAQVLVGRDSAGRFIECRTGKPTPLPAPDTVVSYEIGTRSGRIVIRADDGRTRVTTWTRAAGGRGARAPTTAAGPPTPANRAGSVSFAPGEQSALVSSADGQSFSIYQKAGQAWRPTLRLASGLRSVIDAQLVDDGTLVAIVSVTGGFELYDSTSGRLLIAEPLLSAPSFANVTGFSAHRDGDILALDLHAEEGLRGRGSIRIPVSVDGVSRQLCSLYPVSGCA